jgi:thioredoxin 1
MALKNRILLGLALATTVLPTVSYANWVVGAYDAAKFEAIRASGKPVLLEFYAAWCTVCTRQEIALKAFRAANPGVAVFQVDYDGDRSSVRKFGVTTQGTIIAFNGGAERGRLVGKWKLAEISQFATTAIGR